MQTRRSIVSLGRVKGDESKYNEVARKVMEENSIAIDDLCAIAAKDQEKLQQPHNVHFTKDGYQALAQSVADSVNKAIGR